MTAAPRLAPAERALLFRLADPLADPPDAALGAPTLGRLLDVADAHGVLPVVWRKLAATVAGADDPALRARHAGIERRRMIATGQAMLLSHHARVLAARLRAAGIAFTLVKGEVFARRLYPAPADRPFTDVDVLVEPADFERANRALEGSGFRPAGVTSAARAATHSEFKWVNEANPSLLVEVHGDLVHYPALRARRGFGYRGLVAAGGGDPQAPAALLLTAIVHAALGHKFHALRLVVDVLQAARALPAEEEAAFLAAAAGAGLGFEAAVALDLVARLFGDRRAAGLAAHLPGGPARRLARVLLTPAAIADAPCADNRASRARRVGFRLVQHVRHALALPPQPSSGVQP